MPDPKFVINGREYPIVSDPTMGELADMERITGQGYDMEQGGVLGTLALAFVSIKRLNPAVSIDDIRGLKAEDIGFTDTGEAAPADPLSGAVSSGS